eukprot:TRINITY_DN585_c0_g3_i1.p2 TRINITY_DN585_c0_g3~~TRINITY_DN585_c0_g3_i1.p2  ORF type:complete len:111 (+),score=29.37 TRINITY_DN585_c0_g3_i1:60-392(+)
MLSRFLQSPTAARVADRFAESYKNLMGYRRYGLRFDDLLIEDEVVSEAIRRLPKEEQNARLIRMKLALNASLKQHYLPREQWTTPENDTRYLLPYLEEVRKEIHERKMAD